MRNNSANNAKEQDIGEAQMYITILRTTFFNSYISSINYQVSHHNLPITSKTHTIIVLPQFSNLFLFLHNDLRKTSESCKPTAKADFIKR